MTPSSPRFPGAEKGRVLMVSRHSYPSHTVMRRNADHLARQGLRVDLVCSGARSDASQGGPPPAGLRVIRIPVRHRRGSALLYLFEYAAFGIAAVALAATLTLRHTYLAVQVDNPPDLLVLSAVAARLRGVRVVLNLVELSPELTAARLRVGPGHPLVRINRLCERLAVSLSDHVVTVSETCLRILSRRGLDPARATVVPNGVEVPQDETSGVRLGAAPQLVTQASLIERYGVQVAIRALATLRRNWPDLTLRVIGEGEYRPELERLADALGVADHVVFTGFLPWEEAMRQVRTSTIGLVPVIPDGYGELLLPTKLLEMVEQRVPVVCARLPAIVECFGEDALSYFTPGDPVSLAEKVDRLLGAEELRHVLAGRAQAAADGCRWSAVADRYVAALVPSTAPLISGAASRC